MNQTNLQANYLKKRSTRTRKITVCVFKFYPPLHFSNIYINVVKYLLNHPFIKKFKTCYQIIDKNEYQLLMQ